MKHTRIISTVVAVVSLLAATSTQAGVTAVDVPDLGVNASMNGLQVFPADNPWNTPVDKSAVDPMSDAIIARIGKDKALAPEFGARRDGGPSGFPYLVVGSSTATVPTLFDDKDHSDQGPYPLPPGTPVELRGGKNRRRVIVVSRDERRIYELVQAYREGNGWHANNGAIFDMMSNELRPEGWVSADAAGLPVFPGLVRFDEVSKGAIKHALRFEVGSTRKAFVPPARHWVGRRKDKDLPPMGMRVRLKASFDISKFPPEARVILKALKTYGMIVADTGQDWGLSGTADSRWNDTALSTLGQVKGSDFEVVEMSGLVVK